jgi:hypothetical protein
MRSPLEDSREKHPGSYLWDLSMPKVAVLSPEHSPPSHKNIQLSKPSEGKLMYNFYNIYILSESLTVN